MSASVWRDAQPASPLRLVSVNANGLRNAAKLRTLLTAFEEGPWDALVVQEAHAASASEVEGWLRAGTGRGSPFEGSCFVCPHTTDSAGVLALFKANAPVTDLTLSAAPAGGRLLLVSFSYAGLPFSLVDCYAPCTAADRPGFFTGDLARLLPADRLLVGAGDWNFVGDLRDVVGAAASPHRMAGAVEFDAVAGQHGLVDAWRHLHPDTRAATHFATNGHGGARLDRWYVSAPLLGAVSAARIVQGLPGDHLGVDLTITPPTTIPLGPGRFRLPLHFLSDSGFYDRTSQCITAFLQDHPFVPDGARDRWVSLKARLTEHCMAEVAAHRQRRGKERRCLLAASEAAFQDLCERPEAPGVMGAWRQAAAALAAHTAAREAERSAQQGVLWHCYGERPTSWFHRLGKEALPSRPFTAVCHPTIPTAPPADMCSPEGRALAAEHAVAFFSADSPTGLFRPEPTDAGAAARLLDAMDVTLTPQEATATVGPNDEGYIEPDEVAALFSRLPAGSSPGLDGLPYEFYATFWGALGGPFCEMAAEALAAAAGAQALLEEGEEEWLPPEVSGGLIVLLAKPGDADPNQLSSRRPITVLNCDYRLLAQVVAARFARPLCSVIDPEQTAFLPGRWIGDNVLTHLEEVTWLQESGTPGCVVWLDFEKAYDRCHRPWIFAVMRRMGFPEQAVRWVQVLLSGTAARVSLNGHHTPSFPVRRSVQQGSPLSVLLYAIAAQPLAAALRRAVERGVVRPLMLPGGVPAPVCQLHADDTSLHVESPRDAAACIEGPVRDYEAASNARRHEGKSKGMLFGDQSSIDPVTRRCGVCAVTFPPPQDPIRHLGIHMGKDARAALETTFAKLQARVRAGAAVWARHDLSWLGRAHVAKQVLSSIVVHHVTFVVPPPRLWQQIVGLVYRFVAGATLSDGQAGGAISHPARHVAALPWDRGGVRLVDPALQAECLQAKVAARLLQPGRQPWKLLLAARLFAAFPTLGPAVLVSGLQVTHRHGLDGRALAYTAGLQQTLPHRVVAPSAMSTHQVLVERLFYNRQVRDPSGAMLCSNEALMQPLVAAGVCTVGRLRDALQRRSTLALQIVWACLPPEWREAALQPPTSPWQLCRAGGRELVAHQTAAGLAYFDARPDGSLRPLGELPPVPATAEWVHCCVVACPAPGKGGGEVPMLVGPWTEVVVDPSVWGHGEASLCHFTVRAATQRRIELRARQRHPDWYVPGAGARPRLWPLPAGVPGPAAALTGLQSLELRWASSFDRRRLEGTAARRRSAEFEVELLPCQRPGKRPRLGVFDRLAAAAVAAAEREPAPVAPRRLPPWPLQDDDVRDSTAVPAPASLEEAQARQSVRGVWQRLRGADLTREQHALGYRLLHGSLYVGAFLCHIGVLPPADACCQHEGCAGAAEPPLETLTHAFLTCPAVAPAAAWVCDVFAAASGGPPPPACPRVFLADETTVWAPPAGLGHLWTHLRLAYLLAVWRLRARRSLAGQPFDAAAVCGAVVATVRAAIRRDWTRATHDVRRMDGTYAEWFRGRDASITAAAFHERWSAGGALCGIAAGGGLDLRFSLAQPVPAPAAGAGGEAALPAPVAPAAPAAGSAAPQGPGLPLGEAAQPAIV